MASGLPAVVVRDPAFEDIVFDKRTGLVSDGDESEFVKKVESLLTDSGLREKLGLAGKELVEKEFSAGSQAKNILSAYKKATQINAQKRKVRRIFRSRIGLIRDFLNLNVAFAKFKGAMSSRMFSP